MSKSENIKTNIMLADSNPLVLTAMSEIFERDARFSLVATSSTAEGFLGMAMRITVDIGVIDWNLPALGGAKLIEVLREQDTAPRIVVYGDMSKDLPRITMSAGAAAFASRSDDVDGLLSTCADVAQGKMVFPFLDVRQLQKTPPPQNRGGGVLRYSLLTFSPFPQRDQLQDQCRQPCQHHPEGHR